MSLLHFQWTRWFHHHVIKFMEWRKFSYVVEEVLTNRFMLQEHFTTDVCFTFQRIVSVIFSYQIKHFLFHISTFCFKLTNKDLGTSKKHFILTHDTFENENIQIKFIWKDRHIPNADWSNITNMVSPWIFFKNFLFCFVLKTLLILIQNSVLKKLFIWAFLCLRLFSIHFIKRI